MKQFNLQFANHSKLEQLKLFFLEHGTYIAVSYTHLTLPTICSV